MTEVNGAFRLSYRAALTIVGLVSSFIGSVVMVGGGAIWWLSRLDYRMETAVKLSSETRAIVDSNTRRIDRIEFIEGAEVHPPR